MKKSKLLVVSSALGILYSMYIFAHFTGALSTAGSDSELIGGAIATALVTPHIVLVVLAAIFNVLSAFQSKRGFALTSAILYVVGAIVFIPYAVFVIPMAILTFIGYAKLKKSVVQSNYQSQEE
ncbi:MAG TPA: hypothetical protein DHN33_10585 [Eubacteriaceae bacterium]|nr:hypothetical protein [Eubacteriaceae bacterium]